MKIEIFTRDGCPFCDMAVDMFKQNGIEFKETVLNDPIKRQEFYDQMNQDKRIQSNVRTVPQIFIDDEHIGGFSDLSKRSNEFFK
ncbi:glutaredoxin domain-containing protein [Francisella adeliensis]|uniref:Glutaredoxin n=1 Tax=Francisella adeliensis TaxID=2007306 RepID=A0A2Z4XYF9_9GAMM|nr:glutaredoxin domain-containing protein [Francisella adeliensis]AXA33937.1 glutaredoxin [Francisella adeliensis]MBK2085845.1 glutaredoxin [Francisella adeliensis]MBK2097723.1 glutaredoxin [Francisella adeliensis]QIW12174.1 glutaredoxin [Francisella adeliensis]QIW14049.1 glutaredoxin [Francisella adeliensis]